METPTETQPETQTLSENAMERFVRKTRALFAKETDLDKRWNSLRPILAELLADPDVIAASKQWPDCVPADGRAENLLFYEDPDYGFAINGLTKGEARQGQRARIHDHAHIYTLYGVLVGPGEIDLVKPYEIHTELTVGQRTVAVIIRSQKGGEFNQGRYIPEKNEYYESLGPRQTPCEMLPKR